MKQLRILLFFLIIIITAVVSCKKDSDNKEIIIKPLDKTFLIPLKLNNYWKFRVYWYDSLQNLVNTDTSIFKVVSDTIIENQHWFKLDFFGMYYTNKSDGVYVLYNSNPSIAFKYPVNSGESFIRDLNDTIKVINTNTIVNLPAGNFECYQFQSKYKDLKLNSYFTPGIGFIEFEGGESWNGGKPFIRNRFILIEYKIE